MADFNTCFYFIQIKPHSLIRCFEHYMVFLVFVLSALQGSNGQSIEMSMCDNNITTGYIVDLKDAKGRQDCTCKITSNNQSSVAFIIKNFDCDLNIQSWKLKLYADGCERESVICSYNWNQDLVLQVEKHEPKPVYLYLFKYHPQTQGVDYFVRLLSLTDEGKAAKLQIQCGLDVNKIPKKDFQQCATTTLSASTTTTTPIPATSSVGSGGLKDDGKEKKLSSSLIIGIVIGGVVLLVVIITLIVIGASRKKVNRRKLVNEDGDSQSQYSYARELPGGKNKNYKDHQKKLRQAEEKASSTSKTNGNINQASHENNQRLPNGNAFENPIVLQQGSKTLPNVLYESGETWWVEAPKKENINNDVNILPLNDIYAKPDKKERKKSLGANSHTSHIQPNSDEATPYTYYNRIVDDEFSFIHNDLYSGHV